MARAVGAGRPAAAEDRGAGRRSRTGPARFRSRTSPICARPACSGCSCPSAWAAWAATTPTTPGSPTSWPAATARPRWCSTCTLASPARWPASPTSWPARWACRRRSSTRATGSCAAAAEGAFYAVAMSERGRRLPAVPADHPVRAGRRRLPHQGLQVVRLRGRARRRVPGGGTVRCGRLGGLAVPGAGRHRRAWRSRRPGTRSACGPPARTTCTSTWSCRPTTLLGGAEGLALLVAQVMPHWMVASYAAVYVGRGSVRCGRMRGPLPARAAWPGCQRAGPGRPGRRGGGGGPAGGRRGGPAGDRAPRASRRPTAGCGGPSCSPAPPRWTWPRPWWRRPVPRRPGAGIRWNGSSATPGAVRCSRPPPTCAPTGSASRPSVATPTRTARRRDGEPGGRRAASAWPTRRR